MSANSQLVSNAVVAKPMVDEYGKMNSDGKTVTLVDFKLEDGQVLKKCDCVYNTWGTLNSSGTNALVICHALTGNASLESWWGEFLGKGKPYDTSKYWVFCANVLSSCYGSTGPGSIDAATGKRLGASFPKVSIRDMVAVQAQVLQRLGVKEIVSVIGGSMGGMVSLEFGMVKVPHVRSVVTLASSGRHQPCR